VALSGNASDHHPAQPPAHQTIELHAILNVDRRGIAHHIPIPIPMATAMCHILSLIRKSVHGNPCAVRHRLLQRAENLSTLGQHDSTAWKIMRHQTLSLSLPPALA
jgi:hypothetical protein